MSAVFPMVQAVLRCGWVNNKHGPECCAGGMRVVYGAGCSWHSVFAVVNRLCVDLSLQLVARSAGAGACSQISFNFQDSMVPV